MHRQRFLLAALLAAFTASVMAIMLPQPTIAQGAAAATVQSVACTKINTTTTVRDFDATIALLLMRSDDHSGAGQATYTSIGTCGSTLFTGTTSAGDFRLDLFNQSARTLWITPNSPINGSQPAGPPAGYYWQKVEAYSKCYDVSGNTVPAVL